MDWITIEKMMPEDNTPVLVTLKSGQVTVLHKIYTDGEDGEPCYQFQDFDGDVYNVVAWMPLPEPYINLQKENFANQK